MFLSFIGRHKSRVGRKEVLMGSNNLFRGWGWVDLFAVALGTLWQRESSLLLRIMDLNNIREGPGDVSSDSGVPRKHDGDLDAEHALAKEDVTGGNVDEVFGGLTSLDHVTVAELHGLGTLSTQLTSHRNLTTLGLVLHDKPQYTVAGPEKRRDQFGRGAT